MSTQNTTTQPQSIAWRNLTTPDGDTLTTAHLGAVTVGRTAQVMVDLKPDWFTEGREKGRSEGILIGPGLFSGPGILHMAFHAETADVDPGHYLAAAPAALLRFHPELAPELSWTDDVLSDGREIQEAHLCLLSDRDGGITVAARIDPVLRSILGEEATNVTVSGTTPDGGRYIVLLADRRDVTAVELFDQLAHSRIYG